MSRDLFVMVVALCWTSASQSRAVGDTVSELAAIRAETVRLGDILAGALPSDRVVGVRTQIESTDAKIRALIATMFEEYPDVTAIIKASQDVLRWRQWPSNPTNASMIHFLIETNRDDRTVLVNYRHWKGVGGDDCYVLQHSFWNRKGYWRLSPSMYMITIRRGKAVQQLLPSPGENALDIRGAQSPPYVLGLTNGNRTPGIVVLDGPHGSGSFATVHFYLWNPDVTKWVAFTALTQDGWGEYSYDEEKNTLRFGVATDAGKKMRSFVFCDGSARVRLVSECKQVGGIIQLKLIITNTDLSAIRVQMPSPISRLFQSGLFRASAWNGEGKEVIVAMARRGQAEPYQEENVEIQANTEWTYECTWSTVFDPLPKGKYSVCIQYAYEGDANVFHGFMASQPFAVTVSP